MTAQTLLEQRANVWEQLKAIDAKPRDAATGLMSVEDATAYDQLDEQYDKLTNQIERDEKHQERLAASNTVDRTGAVPLSEQAQELEGNTEYVKAFDSWMRGRPMDAKQLSVLAAGRDNSPEAIKAAQGVGTGSAGGYLVPPAFRQKLIEQITFVAAMRQFAEVITTETGANLPWATVDETAQEGAILGENTAMTEQDVTLGQASLDAYMYTSKLVRVSFQLLNDNAFDLESKLAGWLGARIGRIQNRHFTVGTGTSQPDGIITSALAGVTLGTGNTTSITYDGLIDLIDSIDSAYINENTRFMMAQATRKVIRKLKDSQNRPLWEPSLQVGQPDTLLGYGVALNNYMAVPAANAKTIGFGDIREAYVIRDVSDLTVMRLTERFAEYLQVGFFAFQRSDGTMQNTSAFKVLVQSAT